MAAPTLSGNYALSSILATANSDGTSTSSLVLGNDPALKFPMTPTGIPLVSDLSPPTVIRLPNGNYSYTATSAQTIPTPIGAVSGTAINVVEIVPGATTVEMLSSLLTLTTVPDGILNPPVTNKPIEILNPEVASSSAITFYTSYILNVPFVGQYEAAIAWKITGLDYLHPTYTVSISAVTSSVSNFVGTAINSLVGGGQRLGLVGDNALITVKTDSFGGNFLEAQLVSTAPTKYPGEIPQNLLGLVSGRFVNDNSTQVFEAEIHALAYLKGCGNYDIEKARWIWEHFCICIPFEVFFFQLLTYVGTRQILSNVLFGEVSDKWLYGMYNAKFLTAVEESDFRGLLPSLMIGGRYGNFNNYLKWSESDNSGCEPCDPCDDDC